MEYLSIPQIADKLNISDNTVRRYIKRFKEFLPSPVRTGIFDKYPEPTIKLIGKIYTWYEKGLSKTEIIGNLQSGDNDTTSPTPQQQPDKFDVLGGKIDALTAAIQGLTTLFTNNATALPAAGQTLEAISGMGIKLLSNLQAETETATTTTLKRKIKPDTTTPPTGGIKNGESLKRPAKTDIRWPADTPPPTGADTSLTDSVTPDRLTDIAGYKRHVINVIVSLKNQGMTLKEIKIELEKRNMKTLTGKESWMIGTIGKLYKKSLAL